jgi:hypothetical protein
MWQPVAILIWFVNCTGGVFHSDAEVIPESITLIWMLLYGADRYHPCNYLILNYRGKQTCFCFLYGKSLAREFAKVYGILEII